MIRYTYQSKFTDECKNCSQQSLCIPSGNLSYKKRRHFLYVCGFRQKQNEAMKKGKENHEKAQEGIPTLEQMGVEQFFKQLNEGKIVKLSEVRICNSGVGIRGVIDILEIRKEGDTYHLWITELKSGFFKGYIKQMMSYGLIMSNHHLRLVYEYKVRKTHRILIPLYPKKPINLNIKMYLKIFGSKIIPFDFMEQNHMTEQARNITSGIRRQLKDFRTVHDKGIKWIHEIPECNNCQKNDQKCSFWDRFCAKIPEIKKVKIKQKYWGRHKLLVSSKPKMW